MEFSYSKNERLKSKKIIELLFKEGQRVSAFPLTLVYLKSEKSNQIGVSVSKRYFKKAVDRNRVKRLLREAYRHNKKMLIDNNINGYALMILYIGKELPKFRDVNVKTRVLLSKFINMQNESKV